jgi:SAM-dependent methyltransferase
MIADVFEKTSAHYDALVDRYGHDHRACDWGRLESQTIRFDVLSAALPLAGATVLDVGCGFADLAPYLGERFEGVRYTGIDLSPRMVERARRLHPGLPIHVANVLDLASGGTDFISDFVVASGIFAFLGLDAPALARRLIDAMFALSRRALAFNSLSAWAAERSEGEYYADPLETAAYCRTLTPRLLVRTDYHPRDFTVALYR